MIIYHEGKDDPKCVECGSWVNPLSDNIKLCAKCDPTSCNYNKEYRKRCKKALGNCVVEGEGK